LDVFSDLVDAFLVGASVYIVNSIRLIGCDEFLVEDSWKRLDGLKVLLEGVDEGWLKKDLEAIKPLPAVLNQEFIAANQSDRVDNVYTGTN
jgi:hypothetical protein